MVKWILGGLVCMVAGGFLLNQYLSGAPALEKLTKVEGTVTRVEVETQRSRRMQSQMLVVQVGDSPTAYYVERFPDYERVVETVKAGDKVTAWVDVGGNNYIWQLEKGGERIVSYDQVAEAQKSNERNNALIGALFVVVGVGIIVVQLWKWKSGANQPPKAEVPA